ncbi:hypothetical protein BU14_1684s0001 [Porphyra umbilicalis]|uniref:Uncharacterized protein n=1 Tax=Porphyra umbilicalis TaxID=2786 RepID=A0A1X6NKV0_PORUM|nr:hypothetical protein BU14_1684s0001 [Porphyra umbilicalis]|eukprot:OSX69261.1 hypothetical protein BU14_1684s0001 [Porphyra umbilicalis]
MGAHPSAVGRLAFITVSGHVYAPSGRRRRVPAAVTSVLPSIPSGRVGHDPCCHTHSRRAARRASPLGVDGGAGDEAVGGLWSRGHKRTVPVAVFGLGCMPAALSLSVLGAGIAIGVAGAIFEVMLNVIHLPQTTKSCATTARALAPSPVSCASASGPSPPLSRRCPSPPRPRRLRPPPPLRRTPRSTAPWPPPRKVRPTHRPAGPTRRPCASALCAAAAVANRAVHVRAPALAAIRRTRARLRRATRPVSGPAWQRKGGLSPADSGQRVAGREYQQPRELLSPACCGG